MKNKRAFLSIILCLILLFGVTACDNIGSKKSKGAYPDFLINRDWEYNTISCAEILRFREDGTFSYYEVCGNPVGDSDCYETYSYDEGTGTITAYGYDDSIEDLEIDVLRYTNDSLLVSIEGVIKEFYTYSEVPNVSDDMYEQVRDYSAYTAIGNISDGMIKTAPSNVDMDAGGRELVREEKLSDEVLFYQIDEKIVHVKGDEPDRTTVEYAELSREDAVQLGENGFSAGFIWYDDNLEITKIVYYGLLEIWE